MSERKSISPEEAERELGRESDKVSAEKVAELVDKEQGLKVYFERVARLKRYLTDFVDVLALLKDFVTGRYREVPWAVIAALAGSLFYVLSPIDLIPDPIPGIGFVDDATVFAAALRLASSDLAAYRAWRASRKK